MGSNLPSNDNPSTYEPTPFGKKMRKHFLFDPQWTNMNHGSFGTYPFPIRRRMREYQDQVEAQPDLFIRYTYPELLDESRAAIAKILNAPISTVVFVPNATTGVNTVLRNLVWNPDGKDEILYFNTIYGACGKTISYVVETANDLVNFRTIQPVLPIEDDALLAMFISAIRKSREAGRRPKVAMFDTVASLPGYRMPFESLTNICKEEGILSLIDGAHGVGHVALDLAALDPDFFISNCHKWLFVPRGCAVLYVPERNQPLIRSTLPTSDGFVPKITVPAPLTSLPKNTKTRYVAGFEFIGTLDNAPYLCIPEAVKWREEVCGGEEQIRHYCINLARDGGKRVAEILGTEILDNKTQTMSACCLVNVKLPLIAAEKSKDGYHAVKPEHGNDVAQWMMKSLMEEFKSFIFICYFQNSWWARLSGQVYLDMEDFEFSGRALKNVCERIGKGEHLT